MPVQEEVIPYLLGTRNDVIALAQTGTGKTAAFGIPLLQRVDVRSHQTQAIVLCPTRELCLQIADDLNDFAKYIEGIRVVPVYGGTDIVPQIRALKKGVHIIVATPGRLIDLMEREVAQLNAVFNVVLDEADEMLNMGFSEDIDKILAGVPKDRNTLLFSATMSKEIEKIANLENAKLESFMEELKDLVKTYFRLENMHSRKIMNRVYRYCRYIYELLGWEKVYQVYSITPIITDENIAKARDAYPIFAFLEDIPRNRDNGFDITEDYKERVTSVITGACESSFSRIIADMHINPREAEAERHTIRKRGTHPFDGTMPEYNEYYMANDFLVNKEHKKVFGIVDEDDYYLRRFITPVGEL